MMARLGLRAGAAMAVVALVATAACVGDPPQIGVYGPRNCTSCGAASACIDVRVDPANCGACGHACAAGQVCNGGACAAACAAPFVACGGRCADLTSDPANCGNCGTTCANGVCAASACATGACPVGMGDCDGLSSNGCETSIVSSVANCGGCGVVCAPPHSAPSCAAAKCTFSKCDSGFLDCDGAPSNGCEVEVASDPAHCGNCTNACPSGDVCVSGFCTLGPPASFASPRPPNDLLLVPRQVNVFLAGPGNATVYYTTDGTLPTPSSPSAPSPLRIVSVPTQNTDGSSVTLRWMTAADVSPRLLVVTRSDATKSQPGFIIEDLTLNGTSPVVSVAAGSQVSASTTLQRWCPSGCRLQIMYALNGVPLGCMFDAAAPAYTGAQDVQTFKVTAPAAQGTYKLTAILGQKPDCASAMSAAAGSPILEIGTILVQ